MLVILEQLAETDVPALNHLVELAAYDLSELSGANVGENGLFMANFDAGKWYEDSSYHLFFIRAEGALAGFVVIRALADEDIHYLNHFFVLRKFRKQQVGRQAAELAFGLFPGKWRVSQFDWNTPAQHFWRKVVKDCTNDCYRETRRKDGKGPAQEFTK